MRALREALVALGVDVWLDESDIETFSGITSSVKDGLGGSKALVAFYSSTYPTRRACQWELTRAFLAAQGQGDPRQRVLVINPESDVGHIEPIELRDGLFLHAPDLDDPEAVAATAARIGEHVKMLSGQLGNPVSSPVQWHGRRPIASARFVGRNADMWRVHSALQADEVSLISGAHGPPLAQAVGLGGIGKSLLAVEYALRYASAYPGGVFWLSAHGHDDVETRAAQVADRNSQLRAFAAGLGVSVEGLSLAGIQSALIGKLDALGRPYLWIVDDLPSGLTRDEIDPWLAPTSLGKTLVTTRSRAYGGFGHLVEIGLLSEQDGLELLRTHRTPVGPDDTEAARGLVRDLGGHALAIDVTGAALAAERGLRSFADYRTALADPSSDELELASRLAGELPTGHERSIVSTLLRSINALRDGGKDFLRIASQVAVEPIPAHLIVDVLQQADGLDGDAARKQATEALNEAHTLSLAETVGPNGEDRAVHALVSHTVRLAASPPERTETLRAATIAALIDSLAPILHRERVPGALVAHARHLADGLTSRNEVVLLHYVSHCDQERGDFHSARLTQERVLDAARGHFGDHDESTCGAMSSLAGTLAALGEKPAALTLFEEALESTRQSLGVDHTSTLSLMNNVAEAHWGLGHFEEARDLHEQTLAGRRRLLGDEHPQTLTSMNNLAGTIADLGDLEGARAGLEEVLAARRKISGDLHPNTLSSMNSLGIVLGSLQDHKGARALHEKTLEGRREALGELHPYTLTSMNNLATTLGDLGDRVTARSLHAATLQARLKVLGERHPDTLTSMSNLAATTGQLGDLRAARDLQRHVVDIHQRTSGKDHPSTQRAMQTLTEMEKHPEA